MTTQEAIKVLNGLNEQCCECANIFMTTDWEDRCEALDMAIEALKLTADEEQFWSEQYQDIDDYPDTDGEAIRYLDGLRSEITDTGSYEYDYLTLAIDALKSFENDTKTKSCSKDTIYRQDAIDEIEERKNANGYRTVAVISELNRLEGYIMRLPSAQPEIIRCKDCKNWDTTWQKEWAKNYHYCSLIEGTSKGDFYCAGAERRADGN